MSEEQAYIRKGITLKRSIRSWQKHGISDTSSSYRKTQAENLLGTALATSILHGFRIITEDSEEPEEVDAIVEEDSEEYKMLCTNV